ncbi:MAG: cob(I)yrinic acid a,c-diamide adenosyltransferase [Thermoguttaceae bacterium]
MTIYTRSGDEGKTDLLGGPRVAKDTARLEACGDLDELDAWLGLARCEPLPEDGAMFLEQVQRCLIPIRAKIVTTEHGDAVAGDPLDALTPGPSHASGQGDACAEAIERAIDRYDGKLETLRAFVLPGGTRAAAVLHLARAVCRRAERRLVTLAREEPGAVPPAMLAYVNRLSDFLFVLARAANARAGVAELS